MPHGDEAIEAAGGAAAQPRQLPLRLHLADTGRFGRFDEAEKEYGRPVANPTTRGEARPGGRVIPAGENSAALVIVEELITCLAPTRAFT